MKLEFIVKEDNDKLSEELKLHLSRRLYKNIRSKKTPIFVGGEERLTYLPVKKGEIITIDFNKNREIKWDLYESKLNVYYEDENYLICYKRPNLLSIPTKGDPHSLFQEVVYYLKNKNESTDISILNRLDKETFGLVLIAKNAYAASLVSPVHDHVVRKYLALCNGLYENDEGRIIKNIKKIDDTTKRIISDDGKIAITNYKVIKRYSNVTLVEFILETGRTHQIRLHSKSIGHPLVGDKLYGYPNDIRGLQLLSYYLKFLNPFTKKEVEIELKNIKIDEEKCIINLL